MNLRDIRHLFDYTEWANDLAMEAADELPDQDLHRETGISHGSILGTLSHMAGAEWIWLERWHGRSPLGDSAWAPWTTAHCTDIGVLREKWKPVIEQRRQYFAMLTDAELPLELGFKRVNGDAGS